MPHSITGKHRPKRPDGRPRAGDRKAEREADAKAQTAAEMRVTKKPRKDQEEREVVAEGAPLKPTDDERAKKKIRALNKKLTAIEALIKKQKGGEELDEQQQIKVDSLEETMQELDDFTSGRRK